MRFSSSTGILVLFTATTVNGLCTCFASTANGVEHDIEAGKRCCIGKGDKLEGNLCNAVSFETFGACCDSQKGSSGVIPSGFDCAVTPETILNGTN
ncbi:uncharacterized protein CTRU02_210775 [Colletotrichum truncatum]|uniref:Uncharacterized protein n=1 Tax=Colletotrichum truncatum TaxID=5467 RepID=A0ACC3YPX0_COLTU|nr:uncharacterized protein CTRU02_03738 [Colletotrichum truncatum]KAF6796760.1 hypothetical protein CTRU02_03738 [Colletotrichum truncatum]